MKILHCIVYNNSAIVSNTNSRYHMYISINHMALIMAALCNRGHYIFVLWFLSSLYLLFFPCLISAVAD